MHLVYDIDLEPARNGRVLNLLAQVAHFVDAVVGGGVYFGNVKTAALGKRFANSAFTARRAVLRAFAIDCARENFGERGFTRSAGAAKEICVPDLIGFYLVFQYSYYMLLPNNLVKGRGAEGAVKR